MAAMKTFAFCLLAALFLSDVSARTLNEQKTSSPPTYKSFSDAISAADKSNLSILLAAVKAAGLADSLKPSTAWTILAPTNEAFTSRLKKSLGVAPSALLEPSNKDLLVKVLSYHVIPAGAVKSSALKNGQTFATLLKGAAPLKVELQAGKKPRFVGATDSAAVTVPDIAVGNSVIHVIDDVLLPEGVAKGKKGEPASRG